MFTLLSLALRLLRGSVRSRSDLLLEIVQPETVLAWHRAASRLLTASLQGASGATPRTPIASSMRNPSFLV